MACSPLYIPHAVKREPFDYLVGSVVYLDGCQNDYKLEGPTTYECVKETDDNATWQPNPETRCIGEARCFRIHMYECMMYSFHEFSGPSAPLGTGAIVGISLAAALLLFFLILLVFVCVVKIHKMRTKGKPTKAA